MWFFRCCLSMKSMTFIGNFLPFQTGCFTKDWWNTWGFGTRKTITSCGCARQIRSWPGVPTICRSGRRLPVSGAPLGGGRWPLWVAMVRCGNSHRHVRQRDHAAKWKSQEILPCLILVSLLEQHLKMFGSVSNHWFVFIHSWLASYSRCSCWVTFCLVASEHLEWALENVPLLWPSCCFSAYGKLKNREHGQSPYYYTRSGFRWW